MAYKLDAERVSDVFELCLLKPGEKAPHAIAVHGILQSFDFHPERIERHRAEIAQMLDELPAQFHEKTGGGWTFLNACLDKHGNQWTGLHLTMDKLFALGLATNKVMRPIEDREMWKLMPGGMPYYMVKESSEV